MRIIKKLFLILYTLILGFIVFCNTSVFGVDGYIVDRQIGADFSQYFLNMQDEFDYQLVNSIMNPTSSNSGYRNFYNYYYGNWYYQQNYQYFAYRVQDTTQGSDYYSKRGWVIELFFKNENPNFLTNTSQFNSADFQNYYDPNIITGLTDSSIYFTGLKVNANYKYVIYNGGSSSADISPNSLYETGIPIACVSYSHPVVKNYLIDSNTSGASQVTTAIQQQTNTIKEESQKQQNAVVTATQTQTNELLDTNNTGNETMSVNDTTADTSADLSSFYTNINNAFTDNSIQTFKEFTFTLPNGDSHTIQLTASTLLNFLNSYPVLKAFYQSIFWVIFGGYVIFDFKKIINKMKEGNIDNVVGSSSPVDSVVNMSLK